MAVDDVSTPGHTQCVGYSRTEAERLLRTLLHSTERRPTGAQTYAAVVPGDTAYDHVLVWCDPYNVGVAAAILSP